MFVRPETHMTRRRSNRKVGGVDGAPPKPRNERMAEEGRPPSVSHGWLAPGYRGDDVFKSVGQFTITYSSARDAAPAGRRKRKRLPSALGAY